MLWCEVKNENWIFTQRLIFKFSSIKSGKYTFLWVFIVIWIWMIVKPTSRPNVGNCVELKDVWMSLYYGKIRGRRCLKVLINRAVSGSLKWSELADKQSGWRGKTDGPPEPSGPCSPRKCCSGTKERQPTVQSEEEEASLAFFVFEVD